MHLLKLVLCLVLVLAILSVPTEKGFNPLNVPKTDALNPYPLVASPVDVTKPRGETPVSSGVKASALTNSVTKLANRTVKIVSFSTSLDFMLIPGLFPDGKNTLTFSYTLIGGAKIKIQVNANGVWESLCENNEQATSGNFQWNGFVYGVVLPPGRYQIRLVADHDGIVSYRSMPVDILTKPLVYNIYLSPSTQENNIGAGDYGCEESRMNQIADVVQRELLRCGINVYRNRPEWTVKKCVAYANTLDCQAYVAIHSNAMGNNPNGGRAAGCEIWTYKKNTLGARLSTCLYNQLSVLTPVKDRGVKYASYYEIRYSKAPSCIIEVDFHDNPARAKWILDNIESIGIEIAKGICGYLHVGF